MEHIPCRYLNISPRRCLWAGLFLLWLLPLAGVAGEEGREAVLQREVSLAVHNKRYKEVFRTITAQTGAVFSYDSQWFDDTQKVSVQQTASLAVALRALLPPGVAYKVRGTHIILQKTKHTPPAHRPAPPPEERLLRLPPEVRPSTISTLRKTDTLPPVQRISPPTHSGNRPPACHSSVNFKTHDDMKKQITTWLLACAATWSSAAAQPHTPPPPDKAVQFTFVYPLGIWGVNTARYVHSFSLNALGGVMGGVHGAAFGGAFNINRGELHGAQLAGVFNHTKGLASGVQAAGVFNAAGGQVQGVQAAGVFNYARANGGVQLAGVCNIADSGRGAVQAAGVLNVSGGGTSVQLAGVLNGTGRKTAVQAAGVLNYADTATVQLAGVLNVLGRGGFQMGLVNVRDTADGLMLGLINIAKQGGLLEGEIAGGELLPVTVGVRSGTERLYAILAFGWCPESDCWSYACGLGTTFRLTRRLGVNLELVHHTLVDDKLFSMTETNLLEQVRPLVYFKLAKHFKVFAGPTLNLYIANNTPNNPLQMRVPYTLYSHYGKKTKLEGWIGGTLGMRF
jgi:hypothetical protein